MSDSDGMNNASGGSNSARIESPIDAQLSAPPAGTGYGQATPANHAPPPSAKVESELIQSRAIVLGTLFLVTGVFGIPLLWMNRKFSSTERIAWTIIVTIYTAILIAIVYMILMWSYRQISGY